MNKFKAVSVINLASQIRLKSKLIKTYSIEFIQRKYF